MCPRNYPEYPVHFPPACRLPAGRQAAGRDWLENIFPIESETVKYTAWLCVPAENGGTCKRPSYEKY